MTGETILIVEDDGLIALYLTGLTEKAGYRIVGSVSSGIRLSGSDRYLCPNGCMNCRERFLFF